MVRPLTERTPIPSPALIRLADEIEAEARRLASIARPSSDVYLHRLWRRLATWAPVIRRLAHSGPASHDVALRMFAEHPDHDRAGEDPLVEFEALGDVISFLTVGDLVLGSVATLFLNRWNLTFDDSNPWPVFASAVDKLLDDHSDAGLVAPVRRLDLGLREARHRVVAHRRDSHSELLSWDSDDAVTIGLVNVDLYGAESDAARAEVTKLLRTAEQTLAETLAARGRRATLAPDEGLDAWSTDRIRASFEALHRHAALLDRPARRKVANAHSIAGYETLAPPLVGQDVQRVTSIISHAEPAVAG